MTNQPDVSQSKISIKRNANQLGYWMAISITVFTTVALVLGITTPPRSGPFCVGPCIEYPYTDAASFVPRDYFWMYPGILLGPLFMVLLSCINCQASDDKKLYSRIGLAFASISATVLTIDYFVQIFVMQPSFLKGEYEHLTLFSQYNPHGIFIVLEDLGYLMMSIAFLFAAMVFSSKLKLDRIIRNLYISGFIFAVVSLIVLLLFYGMDIEYRFECAVILINWVVLIVSGIMLSIFFKRAKQNQ